MWLLMCRHLVWFLLFLLLWCSVWTEVSYKMICKPKVWTQGILTFIHISLNTATVCGGRGDWKRQMVRKENDGGSRIWWMWRQSELVLFLLAHRPPWSSLSSSLFLMLCLPSHLFLIHQWSLRGLTSRKGQWEKRMKEKRGEVRKEGRRQREGVVTWWTHLQLTWHAHFFHPV